MRLLENDVFKVWMLEHIFFSASYKFQSIFQRKFTICLQSCVELCPNKKIKHSLIRQKVFLAKFDVGIVSCPEVCPKTTEVRTNQPNSLNTQGNVVIQWTEFCLIVCDRKTIRASCMPTCYNSNNEPNTVSILYALIIFQTANLIGLWRFSQSRRANKNGKFETIQFTY